MARSEHHSHSEARRIVTADAERAGTADEPGEVEERAVTVVEVQQPTTALALWGTNEPREMTARMAAIADALSDAIKERHLSVHIGQNDYVKIEGWSMTGAMLGVFPHVKEIAVIEEGELDEEIVWKTRRDGGTYEKRLPAVDGVITYQATVDLMTADGGIVGGATAICSKREEQWRDREDNQIASMAQTRAAAKAFRMTLGFIMPMAGYSATPAEEMEGVDNPRDARPPTNAPQAERRPPTQEVRPGTGEPVPIVREMINGPGMLFKWAAQEFAATMDEVLKHFDIDVVGKLPPLVREKFNNDYRLAADDLSRDLMEPGKASDATTETVDQAEAPDAPVHTPPVDGRAGLGAPGATVLGSFASLEEFLARCEAELNKSPADIKKFIGLSARHGDGRILEYVAQNGLRLDDISDALIRDDNSTLPHVSVEDAEQAASDG